MAGTPAMRSASAAMRFISFSSLRRTASISALLASSAGGSIGSLQTNAPLPNGRGKMNLSQALSNTMRFELAQVSAMSCAPESLASWMGPSLARMRAKLGPIQLAKLSGAQLIALTWASSNRIVFDKAWDKFILPLPFGKGALVWSDPIDPPALDASNAEIEAVRLKLENEMNRIAAEADRIAGVPAIEPAPPRPETFPQAEAAHVS